MPTASLLGSTGNFTFFFITKHRITSHCFRSRTVHAKMQSTANDSNDMMMDQGTFAPRKKHQITESTLRLDQANGHDHSETCNSLYKKSFTLPAMEYCPASVLNMEEKSPYKFTREFHNHRFYKPINSNA